MNRLATRIFALLALAMAAARRRRQIPDDEVEGPFVRVKTQRRRLAHDVPPSRRTTAR